MPEQSEPEVIDTPAADIGDEFNAMHGIDTPNPEPTPEPELPEGDEATLPDVAEPEGELEPEPTEAEPDPVLTALQAELAELKQWRDVQTSMQQAQPTQQQAAQSGSGERTVGDLVGGYVSQVPDDFKPLLGPQRFLGLAEGYTPEQEYDLALGTPAGLESFASRIYQATLNTVLRLYPALADGHLEHNMQRAQLDQSFWVDFASGKKRNADLEPHADLVNMYRKHLSVTEPKLTPGQLNQKVESLVRTKLNLARPTTASGGKHLLPGKPGQQSNGHRGQQKPALAGGTNARRTAVPQTSFEKEFSEVFPND